VHSERCTPGSEEGARKPTRRESGTAPGAHLTRRTSSSSPCWARRAVRPGSRPSRRRRARLVTSACRGVRGHHGLHLCGDGSREHRALGARREPVRGAAQGEPGQHARRAQRADDDEARESQVPSAAPVSRRRSGKRPPGQRSPARRPPAQRSPASRPPVTGQRLAVSGQAVTGQPSPASGQRSPAADYGDGLLAAPGRHLERRYGRGFGEKNLRRMLQFAEAFPTSQLSPRCGDNWGGPYMLDSSS
jgi:hypothetical protein